tara:strand:+ start:26205 stop:26768 length:564 start_codon:yes stop_codon:yes gene_type:complete
MNNISNVIISIILLFIFSPLMFIIYLILKISSPKEKSIFVTERFGQNNKLFKMYKFRTMKTGSPQVDTNNLKDSSIYVTNIGKFLRIFSLDELPQLICVLKRDMNLIGPRPALFTQKDLISMRTNLKIHTLKPGITGYAQINGRDKISLNHKIELEKYYMNNKSILLDIKILLATIFYIFKIGSIKH